PCGMQRSDGLPLPSASTRSLYVAAAVGWKGASLRSAAMFCRYRPLATLQTPERSTPPPLVLGAAAVILGLPSAVRGVSGSLTSIHWAAAAQGIASIRMII